MSAAYKNGGLNPSPTVAKQARLFSV